MSATMKHRGYDGSVSYSAEDRLLHGCILGIHDMVSFGGSSVEDLERNFKAAIDEYLAFCKAESKVPDLPFTGTFKLRLPQDLHKRIVIYAERHNTELNSVVRDALTEYLAEAR